MKFFDGIKSDRLRDIWSLCRETRIHLGDKKQKNLERDIGMSKEFQNVGPITAR